MAQWGSESQQAIGDNNLAHQVSKQEITAQLIKRLSSQQAIGVRNLAHQVSKLFRRQQLHFILI